MKILIAEDDAISRRLLEAKLVKWGYEVAVASDGKQAWKILQQSDAPSLAILDWMMPGMDGVDICKSLRTRGNEPYTYVILLSAKSQKQDLIEGINAGADDYITKPFDAHELKARLYAGKRILDLQSELIRIREKLQLQATHDSLTGLPNRLLFSDRLNQSLAKAKRTGTEVAVMFIDLDRFKNINDTLGHDVGDLLLRKVVERLKNCLRDVDTIARMGGDEFTVILTDVHSQHEAVQVAERILEVMSAPFDLNGRDFFASASVGISIFPKDGMDVESLVKNADTAMYSAKEHGRNTFQLYCSSFNEATEQQMIMETSLRRALDKEEFVVYYQPRVDLRSGVIRGAEALVRWRHPDYGIVGPAQFINLAEETGLIAPISEWVMRSACAQNKQWQDAGLPLIDVAVNISARQFQRGDLVNSVQDALQSTGLSAEYLDLELTESTLMSNPDIAAASLNELKAMGVRLSIDDFGTGYSSLSYLKKFPVDSVKIDQSFVRDIARDPDDAAIAGAVVAMAHSLKLKVIAEGVESMDQLEFLRSLNCDEMQGYFISRPVTAEEFQHQLAHGCHQNTVSLVAA